MATELLRAETGNGVAAAHDLFALTDEQILQIEPEAQDIEFFGGERSDRMDPLREDLDLLADAQNPGAVGRGAERGNGAINQDGNAAATNAAAQNTRSGDAATANDATKGALAANGEAPQWLAERMSDPQHGAEARELWQGVQTARQEASAFREVFAKPEDARAAADRARMLDEIDRAYFGVAGNAPEQTSAARTELAAKMMREDPAAFREMVFVGLRALEGAGSQGSAAASARSAALLTQIAAHAQPSPQEASQSAGAAAQQSTGSQPPQHAPREQESQRLHETQRQHEDLRQQEARVSAYAAFERAANEELERGVGGAIERSLQQALPNASRTENGAGLKVRLASAVRQDVEKALQGDQALGEQVARILSGQRLDNAARAQVVRLIGERAQQLVPGATRRVLADWTQTTLSAHSPRTDRSAAARMRSSGEPPAAAGAHRNASVAQKTAATNDRGRDAQRNSPRDAATSRSPRKIDYRRVSDDDILDS